MMNGAIKKPNLLPVTNGWAAHDNGLAAHELSHEDAIQKFLKAEQRHEEIDRLPFSMNNVMHR